MQRDMNPIRKAIYIVLGLLFTAIGIVGIVTPVLPTTVFLLIAAALFAKASPRLLSWLDGNKVTGPFLKAYRNGEGVSRRQKTFTLVFLWVTLLVSAWFVRERWWLLAILAAVGVGVTLHVALLPKYQAVEVNTESAE